MELRVAILKIGGWQETCLEFGLHLLPSPDLSFPLSCSFGRQVGPPMGSILMESKGNELHHLFLWDFLVIENPFNGLEPLQELVGIKSSLKFRNLNLDASKIWCIPPIPYFPSIRILLTWRVQLMAFIMVVFLVRFRGVGGTRTSKLLLSLLHRLTKLAP